MLSVVCNDEIIGVADIESVDTGMGVAWGRFVPHDAYEKVRHVFRLFARAQRTSGPADSVLLAMYYSERDKLRFKILVRSGVDIPVSVVHIVDMRDDIDVDCEIEIYGAVALLDQATGIAD